MSLVPLTLATARYDRTAPLADGRVTPRGVDLNVLFTRWEDTFWRMIRHDEYDVSEMSLSSFIMKKSEGDTDLVGIPVFLSRVFRHSSIYVNAKSGIEHPRDLVGKRVGVSEYQITACLWVRGILQHYYGVHPTELIWLNGGLEEPGRREKIELKYLPEDLRLSYIPDDTTLNTMLVEGEIDALVSALPPSAFAEGRPEVRRLFRDVKSEEIRYFKETGFFPPMHTVVMRGEIYRRHPWVANSLFEAFSEAKQLCGLDSMFDGHLRYSLPLLSSAIIEHRETFGDIDMWPYGFEENRHTIETMIEYSVEQGLSPRRIEPEELFAPTTLETSKR